jgi:predicted GNAT superfamily acetyltransferase
VPSLDDLRLAEQRADVVIRSLNDLSELRDARYVFDTVWPSLGGSTQIQSNLLRALVHAGGYASAAYRGDEPIGAAFAVVGRSRRSARGEPRTGRPDDSGRHEKDGWHTHLHSHMAAVLEPYRDQHIGAALKMHQRDWALDKGIDTIVWTFDPLVRRNAVLNLVKLGVDVDGFEVDFYGEMDDEINTGDPSDRLFAWWRLSTPKVEAALRGELLRMDVAALRASGRDVIQIDLPADIVATRIADPAEAARWRFGIRAALISAFADGYAVTGVSVSGDYVLERT